MSGFKGLSEVKGHWPGAAWQERSCPSELTWVCLMVIEGFYRLWVLCWFREVYFPLYTLVCPRVGVGFWL